MSLTATDFTTITSSDGDHFIVESRLLPNRVTATLPYPARIV
jgi:hypothetical protein